MGFGNVATARASSLLAALLVTLALAGCGKPDTAALLTSAKTALEGKDLPAAVLQLKSLLQQDPDSAEARFLLGRALLEQGQPTPAAVELRKAQELKYPDAEVVPVLVQAMLREGDARKVVERFGQTDLGNAPANAQLRTWVAIAHAELGERRRAEDALAAALAAAPDHLPALLQQVRFRHAGGTDVDTALEEIEHLLRRFPASAEAWTMRADLLWLGKRDGPGAEAAYRKVIELDPAGVPGHAGLVTVQLARGALDDAKASLDVVAKTHPANAQVRYLRAQLQFQQRDFKTARETLQQVLRVAPDDLRVLQLAGAVEYELRSLLQAEGHLSRALKLQPNLPFARRLLAQSQLRSGQAPQALETLKPLLASDTADAGVLALAAEAHLQQGQLKQAEQAFAQAARMDPKNPRMRTALAVTQLAGGAGDSALLELQQVAASDADTSADMALISAHLRRGEFDRALKAIDGLERKQDGKPMPHALRGRVHLARKDTGAARTAFERALALDPVYFPAVASLAALDLADKKPDAARKRFEGVLAADPKSMPATLALVELAIRERAPRPDITARLQAAVKLDPADPRPRLMLVEHLLRGNEASAALAAAQDGANALPQDLRLLEALGVAQLATRDRQQALSTFGQLATRQPQSAAAQTRLAELQFDAGQGDAARISVKKALGVDPGSVPAQRLLVSLDVRERRWPEALATARQVKAQRPSEAAGYLLEGDVEAARRNWDAALAVYRAGLSRQPESTELATRVHGTLVAADRRAEADRFEADWTKARPKDAGFHFYLGDRAIARKDTAAAEAHYRRVLELVPDNALALNNVAWTLSQQKKPGAAELARQALERVPDQPAFLDTLAGALAAEGQLPQAIETQRKALSLLPEDPALRLHLARLYLAAGRKGEARTELETLSRLGERFPQQAEVAELLKGV